jgi:hypothetical protein
MQNQVMSKDEFLALVQQEIMNNGNISIRGVGRCCGVHHTAIARGGDIRSQKLSETLANYGFQGGDLIANGFPPEAVWLTIEYYAYDSSRADSKIAKSIARSFGAFGVKTILEELRKPKSLNEENNVAILSPTQLLKLQVEAMIAIEEKQKTQEIALKRLELEQQNHSQQLTLFQEQREQAIATLTALPAPTEKVPEIKDRTVLNTYVRQLAHKNSLTYRDTWNHLYRHFRDRYHVDLKARARNQNKKPLDVAEDLGMIQKLYAVVHELGI